MTALLINLPDTLESKVDAIAKMRQCSPEQVVIDILSCVLEEDIAFSMAKHDLSATLSRRQQAMALLCAWRDEADDEEQKTTGDYLTRVLDEDRSSDRKLFPTNLQGITW